MRNCKNCKHSEPIGGGLACMGQKGMPFVKPTDCCDGWKTNRQTNADLIRAMTDEELDKFLSGVHNNIGSGRAQIAVWQNCERPIRIWRTGWLNWLKQEATE